VKPVRREPDESVALPFCGHSEDIAFRRIEHININYIDSNDVLRFQEK